MGVRRFYDATAPGAEAADDDLLPVEAAADLRAKYGAGLPAVLVTADRSPAIRDAADEASIRVFNKPLKPAALRALLSQWRVLKGAAEFYLEYLYDDPTLRALATGPSVSPERGGEAGPGCVHDRAVVAEVFAAW